MLYSSPDILTTVISVLILAWILIVPGIFLLRLLKIRCNNSVEYLLYGIGASIFLDIVIALVINYAFLVFKSDYTFTADVIRIVWGIIFVVTSLLIVIFRSKVNLNLNYKEFIIPCLIYICSVLLIYQTSLLTNNLIGSDIHLEYFYADQAVQRNFSDLSVPMTINICLPITLFLPMFSMLVGMDMMWVFKIIQPLIFAIFPVIVYLIYKSQFSKRVAVIAIIFLITLPMFTMDLIQLIRQQFAVLFFMLLILLLVNRDISTIKKIAIGALFAVGVIISHYGLGVGVMCYMLIGSAVMCILKIPLLLTIWQKIVGKAYQIPADIKNHKSLIVWIVITIICCVSGVLYYVNVGSGIANINALQLPISIVKSSASMTGDAIVDAVSVSHNDNVTNVSTTNPITTDKPVAEDSLFSKMMDTREPLLRTVVGLDFAESSDIGKLWRILQYLVELCLLIGVIRFIFRPNKNIKIEYVVLTIVNVCMIIGAYLLPGTYSYGMGAPRIIMMMLLFTSPFFVYGIDCITRFIMTVLRLKPRLLYLNIGCFMLLAPYILFNSGAVFEMIKYNKIDSLDIPFSSSLSGYRLDMNTYFTDDDLVAMAWLKDKVSIDFPVYSDVHGWKLAMQTYEYDKESLPIEVLGYSETGYVFLRKWNVDNQKVTVGTSYGCRKSIDFHDFSPEFGWVMRKKDGTGYVYISTGTKPMEMVLSQGELVYNNGAMIYRMDSANDE